MDRYTETINALMGALRLDDTLCSHILDIIPKLVEARAQHWIKGEHGYFAGSYSDGNNGGTGGLTKGGSGGIMIVGSGDVALEYQRYGRNKSTVINNSYIDGGEYRRKFDNATDNPEVNKTLYECAKAALKHRSGTLYEDMYWIDGETGKVILSITNSTDERAIVYTERIKKIISEKSNIVTVHTHPSSMPPSVSDLNSCYSNRYVIGFVACHNGKLFAYSSNEVINERIYSAYIERFLKDGYSEYDSQLKALERISQNFDVSVWEVHGNE